MGNGAAVAILRHRDMTLVNAVWRQAGLGWRR
jgi:hypothetical protein